MNETNKSASFNHIKKPALFLKKEFIAGAILFYLILPPFLDRIQAHPFHPDENLWILNTQYYKLFFLDKNLRSERWQSLFAYDMLPLGKYIMGFTIWNFAPEEIPRILNLKPWNFYESPYWNIIHHRLPPQKSLILSRLTMACLGILTCLILYWIGFTLFNYKAGFIAGLLLAYNPLMLLCSRRAMTNAPLLFFLTANCALMILFYRALMNKRIIPTLSLSLLIGLNMGCATATKGTGALTFFIFISFVIFFILIQLFWLNSKTKTLKEKLKASFKDHKIILALLSFVLAVSLGAAIFIAVNPFLYEKPIEKIKTIIQYRIDTICLQRQLFGPEIITIAEKIYFVLYRTLFPSRGHYLILSNFVDVPLDLYLFIIGLIILIFKEIRHIKKNVAPSLLSIPILWVIMTFVGIIAWIPLDWNRYYLPVIPCIALIESYPLSSLIDICWKILQKNFRVRRRLARWKAHREKYAKK